MGFNSGFKGLKQLARYIKVSYGKGIHRAHGGSKTKINIHIPKRNDNKINYIAGLGDHCQCWN